MRRWIDSIDPPQNRPAGPTSQGLGRVVRSKAPAAHQLASQLSVIAEWRLGDNDDDDPAYCAWLLTVLGFVPYPSKRIGSLCRRSIIKIQARRWASNGPNRRRRRRFPKRAPHNILLSTPSPRRTVRKCVGRASPPSSRQQLVASRLRLGLISRGARNVSLDCRRPLFVVLLVVVSCIHSTAQATTIETGESIRTLLFVDFLVFIWFRNGSHPSEHEAELNRIESIERRMYNII